MTSFEGGADVYVAVEDSLDKEMAGDAAGLDGITVHVADGGSLSVALDAGLAVEGYRVTGSGALILGCADGTSFSASGGCAVHGAGELEVRVYGTSVVGVGGTYHGDVTVAMYVSVNDLDMGGCGDCRLTVEKDGDLSVEGVLTVGSSESGNVNRGALFIDNGAAVEIPEGAALVNDGDIWICAADGDPGSIVGGGVLVNRGTVELNGGMHGGASVATAVLFNSGTVTLVDYNGVLSEIGADTVLYMSGDGKVRCVDGSTYGGDVRVAAGDSWTPAVGALGNVTLGEGATLVLSRREFTVGAGKLLDVSAGTLVVGDGASLYVGSFAYPDGTSLDADELSLPDGSVVRRDPSKSTGTMVVADDREPVEEPAEEPAEGHAGGTGGAGPVHSFTVYYDANGGYGAPGTQRLTSSSARATVAISSTEPERSGYAFLGWSTDPDAAEADYRAGGSISLAGDGSFSTSVTLYAVWAEGGASVSGEVPGTYSADVDGGFGSDLWFWLSVILVALALIAAAAWRGRADRRKGRRGGQTLFRPGAWTPPAPCAPPPSRRL